MSRETTAGARRPSLPPIVVRQLATAVLGLLFATCADPQREPVVVEDLGARLDFATLSSEIDELTLGSDDDEPHLLAGWSYREVEPRSGRSFRWGLEPRSELVFTVVEPRPLVLRLEARPRRGTGSPPGAVQVALNGRAAGELELATGRRDYSLELPAELLARGDNRLTLTYELAGSPATPADDDRRIAVAWYRIVFTGLHRPATEPRYDADRDLLYLPFGSRVDYYLRARPGAVFRSPRRRSTGGSGHLGVFLATDGEPERRLGPQGPEGAIELPLIAAADEPLRLSLTAVADGPADGEGGILLESPAVVAEIAAPPSRPAAPAERHDTPPANLIIYLVDTLRADHLGCYGYPRDVSPRIDRFAAGATLFENFRAQASWTLPSVASVMTGLWPPAHGVFEDSRRLAPEAVTLAEVLSGAGYQTAAIVTNGFATGAYGLDQGFDELTLIKSEARKSHLVHQAAVDWLGARDPQRPFFLYLHTVDPHKPYLPAESYRREFAGDADEVWRQIVANPRKQRWEVSDSVVSQLYSLYDAEIAENDASFGDTLDALAATGLYDEALIVFLSDHGEEFHEHSAWTHASNLFQEVLNVPLIVKLPGQREGRRVGGLAQQVDLMPTLLTYLGIDAPAGEGRLLPGILGAAGSGDRRVFSHTKRSNQTTASVIDGDWKFIRRVDETATVDRLFHWRKDPLERHDLVRQRPVLAGLLATALEERLVDSRPPGVADAAPDEAVLDNLRDLGYVD